MAPTHATGFTWLPLFPYNKGWSFQPKAWIKKGFTSLNHQYKDSHRPNSTHGLLYSTPFRQASLLGQKFHPVLQVDLQDMYSWFEATFVGEGGWVFAVGQSAPFEATWYKMEQLILDVYVCMYICVHIDIKNPYSEWRLLFWISLMIGRIEVDCPTINFLEWKITSRWSQHKSTTILKMVKLVNQPVKNGGWTSRV